MFDHLCHIPLCLNRKFRNLYRSATQNTPTSNSENFSNFSEPILQTQRILELESCDTCTRTEPSLQIQRTLESSSCDTCTRTAPILQIASKMKFTKPLETQRDGSITNPCPQENHCFSYQKSIKHVRVQTRSNGTGDGRLVVSTIFGWFRPSHLKFARH